MEQHRRSAVADLLIVGGGLAGLAAATEAAAAGARVVVATAGACGHGASALAQGGVAVPRGADDVHLHVSDTRAAGRGLCEPAAVEEIVAEAVVGTDWLRSLGLHFDSGLSREGGHSRARILHCGGDRTGAHIMAAIGQALPGLPRPPRVLEHHRAVSLCMREQAVTGVQFVHGRDILCVDAGATILATGGLGRLYSRTTNPPGACGDGVALAVLAGAVVRDMEFVQFHPTALADGSLVTEAVRGAGARLVNAQGDYFMRRYDPQADLAPRDVVARAVQRESLLRGPVKLDLRGVRNLAERFPGLVKRLEERGFRAPAEPVPVMPVAHYAVGGVKTDLTGRTTVEGLYAVGEVASTGMHGANRLASNSMLEALVMGRRSARAALGGLREVHRSGAALPVWSIPSSLIEWLPRTMELQAGVLRDGPALHALETRLTTLWQQSLPGWTDAESAHHVLVSWLIVRGALQRRENRGVHWRTDAAADVARPYHLEQSCTVRGAPGHALMELSCERRSVGQDHRAVCTASPAM